MLEVTESARKELESYFADKEKSAIRIYLAPGGWSGPRLALALDEPNDDDKVFQEGEFTFCINNDLLQQAESVRIDLTYMGFTVESAKPFGGGACGSCSTSGCSGS